MRLGLADGLSVQVALLDHGLHPVSCLATQLRYDVSICVHRQSDLRMAENVHYYPWRHALSEEQGCA
jgi:hypothetical protein